MQLAGITLSDHLVLHGLETAKPIAHSQRRTLGGISVVQTAPMVSGRTLILEAENHLNLQQIQYLQIQAQAGQTVLMVHDRITCNVLIVDFDVDSAFDCVNPDPDAWYSGKITMIEV